VDVTTRFNGRCLTAPATMMTRIPAGMATMRETCSRMVPLEMAAARTPIEDAGMIWREEKVAGAIMTLMAVRAMARMMAMALTTAIALTTALTISRTYRTHHSLPLSTLPASSERR
jgi:stage V sporulation protein SpoVS